MTTTPNKTILTQAKKSFHQLNKHLRKFDEILQQCRPLKRCEQSNEWHDPIHQEELVKQINIQHGTMNKGYRMCLKKRATIKALHSHYNGSVGYNETEGDEIIDDVKKCIEGIEEWFYKEHGCSAGQIN